MGCPTLARPGERTCPKSGALRDGSGPLRVCAGSAHSLCRPHSRRPLNPSSRLTRLRRVVHRASWSAAVRAATAAAQTAGPPRRGLACRAVRAPRALSCGRLFRGGLAAPPARPDMVAAMDAMPDLPPQNRVPIFNMPGVVTASIGVLVAHPRPARIRAARHLGHRGPDRPRPDPGALDAWPSTRRGPRPCCAAAAALAGDPDVVEARQAFARYIVADPAAMPWTFATYALLHGSWMHVIFNSVWLAAFGSPVARRCGALALRPPRPRRRGGGRRPARRPRSPEHRAPDRRLGRRLGPDGGRRPLRVPAAARLAGGAALAAARPAAPPDHPGAAAQPHRRWCSWRSGWSRTSCSASSPCRSGPRRPRSPGTRISAASWRLLPAAADRPARR